MKVLAFDFGASSGRAILGEFDGSRLTLSELHRFSNDPVEINGTLYWDILRLFFELKQGLLESKKQGQDDIASIGIDTWGVDFGLLDKQGRPARQPCALSGRPHGRHDGKSLQAYAQEGAVRSNRTAVYAV